MKKLSSDSLGEKGESKFKELCADAELICNKSDRDRAGWDFIVDFPFEEQLEMTLGKRIAPMSCYIQVKTILHGTSSVKLKLNMAERLAKEIKPSFVLVLKVRPNLEFSEAYLVPMIEDRLAFVLQRLRSESVDERTNKPINQKQISFKPQLSEKIEVTGAALREALASACGSDLAAYSRSKNEQLRRLGFEERPIEARMQLEAKSHEELAEIFLGIKVNVPVLKWEQFETRFGITIPQKVPLPSFITIQPDPVDKGRVIIRGKKRSPPLVFDAELHALPEELTGRNGRIHIKCPLFRIDIFGPQTPSTAEFGFEIESKVATPSNWASFWEMMDVLQSGNGSMEVIFPLVNNTLRTSFPDRLAQITDVYGLRANLARTLSKIFEYAGLGREGEYGWADIAYAAKSIYLLDAVLQGPHAKITVYSEVPDGADSTPRKVILTNKISLGKTTIGYAVKGSMSFNRTERGPEMIFFDFDLHSAELQQEEVNLYRKFVDRIEVAEELDVFDLGRTNVGVA